MTDTVDFIVIGAGSAGCVLARRLSEAGDATVTLLEAGGEADPVLSAIPGAAACQQHSAADWAFTTVPQPGLYDRKIAYPRGRVLGGTSVLNYMVYARGNAGDYDQWAQMGNTGWSYEDVLPYFRKAECNADFDDAYHGNEGPLSVSFNLYRNPLADIFLEAAQQVGHPLKPDVNGADQVGCGYMQTTQRDGRRCSTATGYLDPVRDRPNLMIVKHAHVTRIVVEKGRAVAVEFIEAGRCVRTIRADSEIILSAGSIGSPHIMMLSGLGPSNELIERGIDVVADIPDVGRNMQDHYSQDAVQRRLTNPAAFFDRSRTFDEDIDLFQATGGGRLATINLDAVVFFSVDSDSKWPQCQSFFTPGMSDVFGTQGVALGGYPCRPRSAGRVTLASADPLIPPRIDPNYLSDPDDLRLMIGHIRGNREILNASAFDAICDGPALPETDDDAGLEHFIRQTASTVWHPTSTCRMGPGECAVVAPDLRVHGLDGLSICDASVMPTMVSGNTNAPTIMVAEKGADLVLARV